MSPQIDQNLLGCRVVIRTHREEIEGDVRHVETGCKICIVNGKIVSTQTQLPELYRLFLKDIVSISVVAENTKVAEELKKIAPKISSASMPAASVNGFCNRPQPIVVRKTLPEHIYKLRNEINTDVLTNKVPLAKKEKEAATVKIPDYVVIDKIEEDFFNAIAIMEKESVIGLSMEGVRVGRSGLVCWIGVSTNSHVFLFDMCFLGPVAIKKGLGSILVNPRIVKVVHDCRFVSDAFVHQYDIRLENVFDTQVAAAVVEKQKFGRFNKFVSPLSSCVNEFLNIPLDSLFHQRVRVGHEKEDESRWKQRPLPQHLQEGAAFNVCYLKKLRTALMEILLSEVTLGTTLYLKDVSELSDDSVADKAVTAHIIPVSFAGISNPAKVRNGEVFYASVPKESCDPYLTFSRHVQHLRRT